MFVLLCGLRKEAEGHESLMHLDLLSSQVPTTFSAESAVVSLTPFFISWVSVEIAMVPALNHC